MLVFLCVVLSVCICKHVCLRYSVSVGVCKHVCLFMFVCVSVCVCVVICGYMCLCVEVKEWSKTLKTLKTEATKGHSNDKSKYEL